MENESLDKAMRLLESAEASLKSAREILGELSPGQSVQKPKTASPSNSYKEGENQIIEGIFNGESMVGPGGRSFPIPPNYASKSKLVEGDKLKLSILPNGSMLYKQIEPAPRATLMGTLIREDGQYKVATEEGTFRVILAAVTYYKGNLGDDVTIIVPEDKKAEWAAIEAIIPQMGGSRISSEDTF